MSEEVKKDPNDVRVEPIFLGEIVVKFQMPKKFIDEINNVFEEKEITTVDWSTQLAGKIKKKN